MVDNDRTRSATATDEDTVRADEPKTCAGCGERIETEAWHPLRRGTDDEGNFRLYAFCSEECRAAWAGDR